MQSQDIFRIWYEYNEFQDETEAQKCFDLARKYYTSSNRHYHNLNHISSLFVQILDQDISRSHKVILLNVALFHDVIYKFPFKDNELKSAEFARVWLERLGMKRFKIKRIVNSITATSDHNSDSQLDQLFLDMDLSVLGADKSVYLNYTENIRKEYALIPNCIYKRKRKLFLQQMLQRKHIFKTEAYFKSFESKARENIIMELNTL